MSADEHILLTPLGESLLEPAKWDRRFLSLARHIASWSKDPSTQTGAVIVGPDRTPVSWGYNGFPRGMLDLSERYADREFKYAHIVHCERNAMLFADRLAMRGATLYTWPFASCTPCAAMVIQAGIRRCVAPPLPEHLKERWAKDLAQTARMFEEAGVVLDIVSLE